MGALIPISVVLAFIACGALWDNRDLRRLARRLEASEKMYRDDYFLLTEKLRVQAQKTPIPQRTETSRKPLTGAQLRRINEQQNAAFLEDRGEPTNSEILKEQANG